MTEASVYEENMWYMGASFETKSPTRIIVMTVVQIQQEIYMKHENIKRLFYVEVWNYMV